MGLIDELKTSINKVCKTRGMSQVVADTCFSQAMLESNECKSKIMMKAKAPFGIKATKAWIKANKYGAQTYSAATKECYNGATLTSITGHFRAYNTFDDAVNDYLDLITSARYKKALEAKTVKDCIKLIKEGGYATDPSYVTKVLQKYNKFFTKEEINKVSEFDVHKAALDCIKGKYGNGVKRKKLLGEHYAAVQHEVNKLLVRR